MEVDPELADLFAQQRGGTLITLKRDGLYAGIDPGTRQAYADRPQAGAWEQFSWTKHDRWYDLKADVAQMQLAVNEQTKQLEARPSGDIDGWGGQWEIGKDASGAWTATCDRHVFQLDGFKLGTDGGPAKPLHLEKRGNDFVDGAGRRVSFAGVDGFLDYRIWLDRKEDGLDPFMKESNSLGFQVRRVFLQGDASQNQVLTLWPAREPQWRAQLRPYVIYCNAHGILPLMTLCVDNQVVKSDLPALWLVMHAELKGLLYLASYGNELDKNGGDPNACPNPGSGVFWSRGSRTQDQFYPPNGATATEFHPVRNIEEGRTQMDAVASPFFMRQPKNGGCGMLWLDESYPFDNDTPPSWAYAL